MKKLIKKITLLTLTLAPLQASAIMTQDPSGHLLEIDRFLESGSFKEAFTVGDRVRREDSECEIRHDGDITSISCSYTEEETEVSYVSPSAVYFNNDFIFSKDLYDSIGGNLARFYIDLITLETKKFLSTTEFAPSSKSKISVRVDSLFRSVYRVNGESLPTMRLEMTLIQEEEDMTFEVPVYMVIAKGLPFLGQVAEMGMIWEYDGMTLPPFTKVTGYTDL